jgi:hypothetical protein
MLLPDLPYVNTVADYPVVSDRHSSHLGGPSFSIVIFFLVRYATLRMVGGKWLFSLHNFAVAVEGDDSGLFVIFTLQRTSLHKRFLVYLF